MKNINFVHSLNITSFTGWVLLHIVVPCPHVLYSLQLNTWGCLTLCLSASKQPSQYTLIWCVRVLSQLYVRRTPGEKPTPKHTPWGGAPFVLSSPLCLPSLHSTAACPTRQQWSYQHYAAACRSVAVNAVHRAMSEEYFKIRTYTVCPVDALEVHQQKMGDFLCSIQRLIASKFPNVLFM